MPTFHNYLIDVGVHGPGPHPLPSPDLLMQIGATLHVDIDVPQAIASALVTAQQPVPATASGAALIDTGASVVSVHEPLLVGLGLHPISTMPVGTAAGLVQQPVYMAHLSFPQIGTMIDIPVLGVDLSGQTVPTTPPQSIVCLVGRTLLRQWTFIWNGQGGHWSISS